MDDRCELGAGRPYFCPKEQVDEQCVGCAFYLEDDHWDDLARNILNWMQNGFEKH